MKKFIIGSISGIVIIFAVIYFVLNRHQLPVDSLFKAIPLDASVIIDIKDYNNLRNSLDSDNPLWKSVSQISFFDEIEAKLFLLDSLKKQNQNLKTLVANNPQIFISFHPTGKNEFVPIYYFKISNFSGFRSFKGIIEDMAGSDITERHYEGETIREIILPLNKGKFSYVYLKGLLVISKASILVENVIRQLGATESVLQKEGLDELIKSAGKNYPANIYILINAMPRFFTDVLHSKYKDAIKFISNSGSWTEFDLNIKNDLIVLNGFTVSGKNKFGLYSIFKDQKPQKFELFGKVPSNSVSIIALGISDIDTYWTNYQNYLEHLGLWKSFAQRRDSIQEKYWLGYKDDFKAIFDNECAVVITPGIMDSLNICTYSLIRIKSPDEAEKVISGWINAYSDSTDTKPGNYMSEINIDKEVSFKVFHFPGGNIPESLFGDIFGVTTNEYCLIYDNYLIFGSSPQALKDYINYGILNNTLNTDLEFNQLSDNFSSSSSFFFYHKPSATTDFYENYFKSAITDKLIKNTVPLNSVSSLVYQFSINNKLFIYNNILIKAYNRKIADSPKTVWESQLEGKVVLKPVFLKSRFSVETEIFVQDDKNIVYLLNSTGRILWRKNVGEPVLSEIFPIDYYRNRKLQYLFNTRSKIYLVDRLGNNVEKYPITLSENANNGIAVFDYDNNRKYRIFYAAENRKIYLLDKDCKEQKGWVFGKTENRVTNPLQHFENGNTDYIVFNDNSRIYIVDRKGKVKVKPKANFPLSFNNPVYFIGGHKNQKDLFAATDTTGTIHLINVKGEVTDINLGQFASNHFFDVMDLNSDNIKDFIFSGNRHLNAFSLDKHEFLSIETEHPFAYRPVFYEVATNKYEIGFVSPESEKIYLFNTTGNLHKGFPLRGSTQFSVGLLNNSENRFNLIVGSNNNFLYNYSVQ